MILPHYFSGMTNGKRKTDLIFWADGPSDLEGSQNADAADCETAT
jgi:hypothetical protein